MDLAEPLEDPQTFRQVRVISSHDDEAARVPWEPAFDLVEEAASKIALYEQSFNRLKELAERNADQAEADKCELMDRIADLAKRLQESEANYQKTLDLLEASTQICMLQRMELRTMREILSEGSSHASLMTSYIRRLALIVSQKEDGDPAKTWLNPTPSTEGPR